MKEHGTRMKSTLSIASLLLMALVASVAQADPPSFKLPGRDPDSREPWGAFLGKAAHFVMERQYRIEHPANLVFLDTSSLYDIVRDGKLGDPDRLSDFAKGLRPDITDTRALVLFEIKPDHEAGRLEARQQAGRYLAALNEVAAPGKKLSGGTGFEGSLFLEFEDGGALLQLSWRTPERGVSLYRWSYRSKKPHATWKERAAQQEKAVPREEIEARGEEAEQAIRAAYEQGEWPSGFQGRVYLPVECR